MQSDIWHANVPDLLMMTSVHCLSLGCLLKELAWESEKKRLAVAKLHKHFLDDLEVEHIVLHAFRLVILPDFP